MTTGDARVALPVDVNGGIMPPFQKPNRSHPGQEI
jgi:hypothetical protein